MRELVGHLGQTASLSEAQEDAARRAVLRRFETGEDTAAQCHQILAVLGLLPADRLSASVSRPQRPGHRRTAETCCEAASGESGGPHGPSEHGAEETP